MYINIKGEKEMKYQNAVYYKLFGKYALFTDPLTKTGGEKFSYQVPTYQALKGITESIYWKPTFIWVIDEVRVINLIRMQSQGIRPIHYQDAGNDLSIYTYLRDVEYEVKAHFEWNENRKDLENDRNEHKHWDIAKRMIEKGGRRDIFLGTRECHGYVEEFADNEKYGDRQSVYENSDIDFGIMVHGIIYPDEQKEYKERDNKNYANMQIRLWNCKMSKGVIKFIRPDDDKCIVKELKELEIKQFIPNVNFNTSEII